LAILPTGEIRFDVHDDGPGHFSMNYCVFLLLTAGSPAGASVLAFGQGASQQDAQRREVYANS
jgi:hypothetical protein